MALFSFSFAQQVIVPEGVDCPIDNYVACINNLKAAYDQLFKEKVELEKVNATQALRSTCEANLEEVNGLLEKIIAERTTLRDELSQLRAQLSVSEADLATLRASGSSIDLVTLQATIAQLNAEKSQLSNQLQVAQQQISALRAQMASSQTLQRVEAPPSTIVVSTRIEELTVLVTQLRLQIDSLTRENQALKARTPQAQTVVQTQTVYPDDYQAIKAQLAQLQSQVGHTQTVVQTVYPDDYNAIKAQLAQLQSQPQQPQPQTVYPSDYNTIKAQLSSLSAELERTRASLNAALAENQQLRQAATSHAPMKTAPAPSRPAPAPEK